MMYRVIKKNTIFYRTIFMNSLIEEMYMSTFKIHICLLTHTFFSNKIQRNLFIFKFFICLCTNIKKVPKNNNHTLLFIHMIDKIYDRKFVFCLASTHFIFSFHAHTFVLENKARRKTAFCSGLFSNTFFEICLQLSLYSE